MSMPTDPFRARWIECEAVCKNKGIPFTFSWYLNINLNIKVMKSKSKSEPLVVKLLIFGGPNDHPQSKFFTVMEVESSIAPFH